MGSVVVNRLPSSLVCDEVIDEGRVCTIERSWEVIEQGGPPIVVERTRPVFGATRRPVILVHGFAQNRFTWRVSGRSMVAALAEAGHEVINLELRGHGLSRMAGSGNALDYREYFEDFIRVAKTCSRVPFAIGHSLGGGVVVGASSGVELAGIVSIAGLFTFATHNPWLRVLGRLSILAEPFLLRSARVSTGWAGELLGKMYSVTDIAGFGFPISGWAPNSMEREILEERLSRGFDWTSVAVWLEMSQWANGRTVPGTEEFSAVSTPLLVLAGDADPLVRPQDAMACFEGSGSSDREFVLFDAFHHEVHWGHVDLILGRHASRHLWPVVIQWLEARE